MRNARALLMAYYAVRTFAEKEAEHLSKALRVAALRFWLSRLYDLYLPRDPVHFKSLLQNHIAEKQVAWF